MQLAEPRKQQPVPSSTWKTRVRLFFNRAVAEHNEFQYWIEHSRPSYWLEHVRWYEIVQDFSASYGKGVAVDLGCGVGYHLIALGKKAHYTIGLDLSIESLRRAQSLISRSGSAIDLVLCDLEAIPLRNDVTDCLICTSVLDYFPNKKEFFSEVGRISKRRASLLLLIGYWDGIRAKVGILLRRTYRRLNFVADSRTSKRAAIELARSMGFLEVYDQTFWLAPSWLLDAVRNPHAVYCIDKICRKLEKARILRQNFATQIYMILIRSLA